MVTTYKLPQKILLSNFTNWDSFMDYLYDHIFKPNFLTQKLYFGEMLLGHKFNPVKNNRSYTFFHMTSSGKNESQRSAELMRSERLPWCAPTILNADLWKLKIWPQERKGEKRICIWLQVEDDMDYFVILALRKGYLLPWTAYVANYRHEVEKKEKEYTKWKLNSGKNSSTAKDVVDEIFNQ